MKKRLALCGIVITTLVLLYAAAGYWLAPRLVLGALQERAAALGARLAIEQVRTDPFALAVELAGIELLDAQGRRLAGARSAHVDVAWASLWGDAWTIEEARLLEPFVALVRGAQGDLEWPQSGTPATAAATGRGNAALRVQSLSISDGTLQFTDRSRGAPLELRLQDVQVAVQNLATQGGEARYRLSAQIARGGTLASEGTLALAPLAAHGDATVAGVALEQLWRFAAPGTEPPTADIGASASFAYEEGRIALRALQAKAAGLAYRGIEATTVVAAAPELTLPLSDSVPVSLDVTLAGGGSLNAEGTIEAQPFGAELNLQLTEVPLPLAKPFLPKTMPAHIASGSVSGKGIVQAGAERARFEGTLEVRALRLVEPASGELLLGWKQARTESLALTLPGRIEIGELLVRAPEGRIEIERDGSVNVAQLLGRGSDQPRAPAFEASLRRLRLEGGTLRFADRSLETPFEVTIRELVGTVTGFSTKPGDPALVALTGRVGEYGAVKIRGTIDLDQPKSRADITAQFRNVGLAQLTPYIVKFAGYPVRSGRLAADLRYQVRDGGLAGQNKLVFRELELGEKVERAGAKDLPLELAVALLADAQGRITLDIPVRGDLNDPKFDFGGLIARALGNAIGKIVSAPFRALAGLLGAADGEELAAARFAPGSATLSPPQEEGVAKVAQALAERPQLGVSVRGGYDPQRDIAALRRAAARREIARRAGLKSGGPLHFDDLKTLHAAENLYLDRVGNRLELQALRAREPRYGQALLDALAATMAADAGQAESLATQRAQAVRAALLEHGVAAARIAVEDPAEQQASDEGVPTPLALGVQGRASAGGTRP